MVKLHHTDDSTPGYSREVRGKQVRYLDLRGKPITNEKTLARIRGLVIPPAYRDVWICPSPTGHLQATGRDARGRKQYRYHPEWTKEQNSHKYHRMIEFAKTLPAMRTRIDEDLKKPGLPREKVLAAVIQLLEKTLVRIGNEEYAKTNHSFGLTTLRKKHAKIRGDRIHFDFMGKSHVHHVVDLKDERLAKVLQQCEHLPGYEIFHYVDAVGQPHEVKSEHVNAYLKEISGQDFTAKDFRTWAGTLLAAEALREYQEFTSQTEAKKQVLAAIEAVAKKLGNTKSVCRKCYIHPDILKAHLDGSLAHLFQDKATKLLAQNYRKLPKNEAIILVLLEKRLAPHRGNGPKLAS